MKEVYWVVMNGKRMQPFETHHEAKDHATHLQEEYESAQILILRVNLETGFQQYVRW